MASLESWRRLLTLARSDRVNAAPLAEVRARLGLARQLEAVALTDEAIDHLERVVAQAPSRPARVAGSRVSPVGRGARSVECPCRCTRRVPRGGAAGADRTGGARDLVRRAGEHPARSGRRFASDPDARRAEAFRLSLDGWRQLERKDIPAAADALARALALNPQDPIARYRYGRVLQASRDDAGALVQFEQTLSHARRAPAVIVGEAYLEAARIHERAEPARPGGERVSRRVNVVRRVHRHAARRRARAGTPRAIAIADRGRLTGRGSRISGLTGRGSRGSTSTEPAPRDRGRP